MTRARTIERRAFLRGLAAAPFLLPLARRLWASGAPPKRLVIFMQHNGTQQANFWPTVGATSPILDPILSDPSLAPKTNVIRGISIPGDSTGTSGTPHDIGVARLFTGEKLMSIGGKPWGGGPSVDQIITRDFGAESLTLAVVASVNEPHPKSGFDHRRSFAYLGAGTLKIPTLDPFIAYQQLFGAPGGLDPGPDPMRRLLLRKSVLDSVAGDLTDLEANLGPAERAKIDLHLNAVRSVEQRLSSTLGANCNQRPSTAPRNFGATAPELLVSSEDGVPELIGDMVDLAGAALICGLVRVATVQLGYGGGKWRFAWENINLNCHDQVAHLDTSDAGSTPENTARVVAINRYYATQIARLAKQLDAIPEGDGTMLDNTLIVWGNELGRGDHDLHNVPIVLIGRAGGSLPRGGRLIDRGEQPFQRVGCTVLNLMGHSCAGFGDAPSCGMIDGLV
jgi:hypothetical protein